MKTNTQDSNESPRRIRIKYWCEAELAIYSAMQAIEHMDADVRLTEAQTLLQQAKNKVADFVDERLNSSEVADKKEAWILCQMLVNGKSREELEEIHSTLNPTIML